MKKAMRSLVGALKAKKLTQEQAIALAVVLFFAAILLSALGSGLISSCAASFAEGM